MTARTPATVLRLVHPREDHREARPEGPAPRPTLDDTELLAAVRRGDASAAPALYTRARGQIERTVLHLLRSNDPDHDDLVQLSMLALVGSLDRFRGDCSLDTWISRITARTVYKELRRRRSTSRMLAEAEAADAFVPSTIDTQRAVSMRSLIGRLQHHLDALDPVKAWTLMLHDVCGYDLREVADITEASISAAQSRLVRGRADLHSRIEADPELTDALERSGRGGRE